MKWILQILCYLWAYFCSDVDVVSRKEWGARPAVQSDPLKHPVQKVFIHHTVMCPCDTQTTCIQSMKTIQNFHMDDRGWWDIGYNFLIGGDGRVYEGRGWDVLGAHTKGYNSISIGISFIGNFMTMLPTEEAMEAAQQLIAEGVRKGVINNNYKLHGHRNAGKTACPGDKLYKEIQTWSHFTPDI